MTRVAVFFLGGTISMTGTDGTGAVVRLTGADLLRSPEVEALGIDAEVVDFRAVGSSRISVADLAELLDAADRAVTAGADAVVIVQGTDTLEETSFLLDLWWRRDAPVVVTGAMRNPGLPGPDGPANLVAALRVSACPDSRGLGALVVLNDEVHAARFVAKRHTSSVGAFVSPNAGPLARVEEGRVRFLASAPRHTPVGTPIRAVRVPLIVSVLDDDGGLFDAVTDCDGLVVAAFGVGHLRPEIADRAAALAATRPVVLASRTGAGTVHVQTYGGPGSESDLVGRGLLPAGTLDAYKARLLLLALLASGLDTIAAATAFTAYVGSGA
ncbi:MAG TPA: asparaginase [Flexivirga sp.]|uniref:asparaginase n=1 Tax=Flexivirga sp. TaxID=1962927 RepID=UPI002C1B9ECE|nr:asparaginase [Flexivirga sp.]HWC23936.1 asparaginase [Flexivirga sp.]